MSKYRAHACRSVEDALCKIPLLSAMRATVAPIAKTIVYSVLDAAMQELGEQIDRKLDARLGAGGKIGESFRGLP